MKYIRTKKGEIIAFGREYAYPTIKVKGRQHYIYTELTETKFEKMKDFNKWDILAQADTIEELIDWYELVGDDRTILYYNCTDFRALKDKILSNKAWIGIYGCIKIKLPSGAFRLEPVAVIKEGGKLELI